MARIKAREGGSGQQPKAGNKEGVDEKGSGRERAAGIRFARREEGEMSARILPRIEDGRCAKFADSAPY